jgi:hypothetical protein
LSVDLSVVCGLLSALSYGIADYLSRIAGRAVGVWRTSFYYYVTGLALVSIWFLVDPHSLDRARTAPTGAWLAGVGHPSLATPRYCCNLHPSTPETHRREPLSRLRGPTQRPVRAAIRHLVRRHSGGMSGVQTGPGATAFRRMPSLATTCANPAVK